MKAIIFIVTISYIVLLSDSRLVGKITEKTTPMKPGVDLFTRVTRAAFDEDTSAVFSKEDVSSTISGEMLAAGKTTQAKAQRHTIKVARTVRDSGEVRANNASNFTTPRKLINTSSVPVKKPIPKFYEIDTEDDFQSRLMKSQTKFTESGEHEDEDFNVDDYDFDVNHDEFAGRGKPLEPRVKNKQLLEQQSLEDVDSSPVKRKHTKVQQPTKVVSKRHHVEEKSKKVLDKMKEDYYDDDSSAIKNPEHKKQQHDSEESNESEDSKEYVHKNSRTRRAIGNFNKKTNLSAEPHQLANLSAHIEP